MSTPYYVAKCKKEGSRYNGRFLRIKQDSVGAFTDTNPNVAFKRKDKALVEARLKEAATVLRANEGLRPEDFEVVPLEETRRG